MREEALTVTELTQSIKQLLELNFGQICLLGEISNLARPSSGHLYFNVKDKRSQVAGVMFRSAVQRCRFDLENGQEVFLFGRVTVYEPRGTYQIIVDRVEPFGAGALQLAFEQLKQKLADEGLFDPERKKELPTLPKGIGIVTSPTGAAIQDILNILNRRFPGIPVLINPVSVQGDAAKGEIAKAIKQLNELDQVDVIIVGRGGGSIEDLWAFNEEVVARAIYKSRIPIISAVGHETDFTIADFVADLRAPTPSAAAELVVPLKEDLLEQVQELRENLERLLLSRINSGQEHLNHLNKRLRSPETIVQAQMMKVDDLTQRLRRFLDQQMDSYKGKVKHLNQSLRFHSPQIQIDAGRQRLQTLSHHMENALTQTLAQKRAKFIELTHVLDTVSPLATMTRGYGILTRPTGKILSSIADVTLNSKIQVRVQDGMIKAVTEQIIPNETKTIE